MSYGGGTECAKCKTVVYVQEERRSLGKVWHSSCFKCSNCNKALESHAASERDSNLYCNHCHKRSFGPSSASADNLTWKVTDKNESADGKAGAIAQSVMTTPKCPRCDKAVYFAEKVDCFGKQYHKLCLKCFTCNHSVDSRTACERDNELYCQICYARDFGPTGYGYAGGSGCGLSSGRESTGVDIAAQMYTAPLLKPSNSQNGLDQSNSGEVCYRCNTRVYFAEKVVGAGMPYHRTCFKCKNCSKFLEAGSESENDKELYCKGCYTRLFGIKAFGYGAGAGGLASCVD